jgi:phage baseplate assembly protein gpV
MNNSEELVHLIKQIVGQQTNSYKPFIYGHIANYDPALHRVRVVFPSLSDGNGGFVVSGWMPLGGIGAGDGFGVQVIPYGGATAQNPTAGEQCMVMVLGKDRGTAAVCGTFFNEVSVPPSASGGYAPGDIIVETKGGAKIVCKGDGSAVNVAVPSSGQVDITAGTATIMIEGSGPNIIINAPGGVVTMEGITINQTAAVHIVGSLTVNGVPIT